MNPLSVAFDEAPFSQIKTEHFKPAILEAIDDARKEIDAIAGQTAPPSFENTIVALEYSGLHLERVTSLFFNLNAAETNKDIQKIAQEVSPLLSEFNNDITLNRSLFERVKAVYDKQGELDLNEEQKTLLDKKYKSFSRNGANLPEDAKKRLRAIDSELSRLKLSFGENVLAETNRYEMHLTEEADLEGLPEGAKEAANNSAGSRGKLGWVITLDYPSYIPFYEIRQKPGTAKTNSPSHSAVKASMGTNWTTNNTYCGSRS